MESKPYEFGPFRLNIAERQLQCNGKVVALTPKAFDVLTVLVANQGRLLTKDELLQKVWSDSFVEESTLVQNVATLRRALGERSAERQFIETVPKVGYRFVADLNPPPEENGGAILVEDYSLSQPPVEENPEISHQAPRRSRRSLLLAYLLPLMAAAALASLWIARRPDRSGAVQSLVVLPFVTIGDAADEYFSDGMTEETISALTGVEGLRVVARSTAFQFKGKAQDVREIGRRLGVEAILEGSVRRQQNQLRVTAQLNRVVDGTSLWSRSWDRELKDIFAIQSEIAQAIVGKLTRQGPAVVKQSTTNLEAYNFYLLGRYHRSKMSLDKARGYFQQAIEKDPKYAAAYAMMADCYQDLGYSSVLPPKIAYPKAMSALSKALALDGSLPYAHTVQADIHFYFERDWTGAERELGLAISLDPTDSESHHVHSHFLIAMGRFAESLEESKRGLELDPLNVRLHGHLVFHYSFARDFDAAIAAGERGLEIDPHHGPTLFYLRGAYEQTGRFEKAIETGQQRGAPPEQLAALRQALSASGARGYWRASIDRELRRSRQQYVGKYGMAQRYARLDDPDEAFRWLERADEDRDSWLVYLKVDPAFDNLRSDPRFAALVKKVGIP